MPGRHKSKVAKRVRSPWSTKALDVNGVTRQRTIVRYNRYHGFLGTYVVLETPVVRSGALVVKLRNTATGVVGYYRLYELGVVAINGAFHDENFVVDNRDKYGRHALPTRRLRSPFHELHERDLAAAFGHMRDED